jgi:predicted phage tail component-like protein
MTDLDFSYGGTNLSTYGFETKRIVKPLQPIIGQELIDIPKLDGLIESSQKFRQYPLVVKGVLVGTSPSNLITKTENLTGFLYSDNPREIIFNNQTDRYWLGKHLASPEIYRDHSFSILDLIFTCNDPFAYDNTATTDTQTSFNVNNDTYVVANAGHYYAYPVITITFNQPQTHIYIKNNSISGNRIDITNAFDTSDELEIDCKNGTVKLNSTADYTGVGSGGESLAEWIMLNTGNNAIQAGTDDATIDVDIEMEFNKPYLY